MKDYNLLRQINPNNFHHFKEGLLFLLSTIASAMANQKPLHQSISNSVVSDIENWKYSILTEYNKIT
ncbi:hypothetical protein ABET51_11620 [Metabacillus fastidiosus]|uniref:hypothetical protein n=1 Tax=Metabacillus fastidiosus TaxID=1458 RepID=UPI003D2D8740